MIKIQIENAHQRMREYTDAIKDLVAFRVSVLKQSLSHLNGTVVNFDTGDFISFKPISKNIIEILGDTVDMPNGRDGYENTINNYITSANHLRSINIAGLLQLCQEMLANNNQRISELLVCDAADLMIQNEAILNKYRLNTKENIAIVRLAFDYIRYNKDISSLIREYFRENKFVKFCPYCNTRAAYHNVNDRGEVVDSFELDHFYDKARYPLLSYCMFNLVPSDHTCNVTNKGVNEFTDEFHINPHFSGYTDLIRFVPIGLNPSYRVDRIELNISEAPETDLYKKINGNNQPDVEQGELGNLNVFKIRAKHYENTHHASIILTAIHANNKNIKHIKKYIQILNRQNIKNGYRKWYEEKLNVRFNPTDFNDKAYSKFFRDIHDHYFQINSNLLNRYIIELIEEYKN